MQLRDSQKAGWITAKLEPAETSRPAPASLCESDHPRVDLKHFFGGLSSVLNLARRLGRAATGSDLSWSHSTCRLTGAVGRRLSGDR